MSPDGMEVLFNSPEAIEGMSRYFSPIGTGTSEMARSLSYSVTEKAH